MDELILANLETINETTAAIMAINTSITACLWFCSGVLLALIFAVIFNRG